MSGFYALDRLFLVNSIERMDPSATLRTGSPSWKGFSSLPSNSKSRVNPERNEVETKGSIH